MKKYLTNNILLKIISVIFAIMLWLIVLNIDDPNTTRTISNIEVMVENADAVTSLDKIYTIASGETATVTVTGPRSIVDKLTASDFIATADFKDLSQTYSVPVVVELKKQTYKDKVVINVKTNTMRLEIEDIKSKEFEVKVKNTGYLEEGYVIYKNRVTNVLATVYAPESVMNTIAGVVAVVPANGQSEDFISEIELSCIDLNGREIDLVKNNIQIDSPTATVNSTVYYSKDVNITEDFENVVSDGYSIVSKNLSENTVTIVGNRNIIEGIDSIIIPSELLVLEEGNKDYSITCNISNILPEGVYLYGDIKEVTVTMHIDRLVQKRFDIDVKKLALVNIPDDYVASIVTKGRFSYTLAGMEEVLKDYQTQDAYNVSLENLTEGTHKVKVSIELTNGLTLISDVYVEVNLEKSGEDETTAENNERNTTVREEATTEPDTTLEDDSTTESETTTEVAAIQ
ncbi:MAG: hypothetical protein IIX45_00195 [Lachnospiraceae bacterium]|nr:hypothetical protein [Lachnospiraceae bacterium]